MNAEDRRLVKLKDDKQARIVLNFTSTIQPFTQGVKGSEMQVLMSNCGTYIPEIQQPFEGRLYVNVGK